MTTDTTATDTAVETPNEQPGLNVHWNWLGLWMFLTVFAVFEVAKHGYVNGTPLYAIVLTVTTFGSFIAPDLMFLIGARRQRGPSNG